MCLIAWRPKGKDATIPHDILTKNVASNPDGFGLMWRDGPLGAVHRARFGPDQAADYQRTLRSVESRGEEFAAHMRIATAGARTKGMAHPYVYRDPTGAEVYVMHNGVISIDRDRETESDTSAFCRDILSNLPPAWWADRTYRWLVEESIGWSRLLIMQQGYSTVPIGYGWKQLEHIWYSHEPETLSASVQEPTPSYINSGHRIILIDTPPTDRKVDTSGSCECEQCGTTGEYYRIDGDLFYDVQHTEEGWALLGAGKSWAGRASREHIS